MEEADKRDAHAGTAAAGGEMKVNATMLLELEHRVIRLTRDEDTTGSPLPIEPGTSYERLYSFVLEEQSPEMIMIGRFAKDGSTIYV